jgi:hypothetical protein
MSKVMLEGARLANHFWVEVMNHVANLLNMPSLARKEVYVLVPNLDRLKVLASMVYYYNLQPGKLSSRVSKGTLLGPTSNAGWNFYRIYYLSSRRLVNSRNFKGVSSIKEILTTETEGHESNFSTEASYSASESQTEEADFLVNNELRPGGMTETSSSNKMINEERNEDSLPDITRGHYENQRVKGHFEVNGKSKETFAVLLLTTERNVTVFFPVKWDRRNFKGLALYNCAKNFFLLHLVHQNVANAKKILNKT